MSNSETRGQKSNAEVVPEGGVPIEEIWQRTENLLYEAVNTEESVIAQSPPASGKTTGFFKVASRVDEQFTYLTKREDLYDQAVEKCEEYGCSYELIPSPYRDCPCFIEATRYYNSEANDLYKLGISARKIHKLLDLDCSPGCRYIQKWDAFDAESIDVLIGHYKHGYISSITEDRSVVVDEFPGTAYERVFYNAESMINRFLSNTDEIPYDTFLDLYNNREATERWVEAKNWFEENGLTEDAGVILQAEENDQYHTLAPFLVFSMLNMESFDNR